MDCPDWHAAMPSLTEKDPCDFPCHSGVRGNEHAGRLERKANTATGLELGKAKVLTGLWNSLGKDRAVHCMCSLPGTREVWRKEETDILMPKIRRTCV